MSMTIGQVPGKYCEHNSAKLSTVYIDVDECDCVTLKQDDDWIELTPEMVEMLISQLQRM